MNSRQREAIFGPHQTWLAKCEAIIAWFESAQVEIEADQEGAERFLHVGYCPLSRLQMADDVVVGAPASLPSAED
jgi:hypothetical protein